MPSASPLHGQGQGQRHDQYDAQWGNNDGDNDKYDKHAVGPHIVFNTTSTTSAVGQ